MSFNKCCDNPNCVKYDLRHDPRPIKMSPEMHDIIEDLLWYIPNIKSYQSFQNEYITKPIYDDLVFNYVISQMNILSSDVKIGKFNNSNDFEYYENKVCVNCQKMILNKAYTETKTSCLLRHVRNVIAHGRFSIINGLIVGFDEGKDGNYSAFIKIYPKNLLKALRQISKPEFIEIVFANAFESLGYNVNTKHDKQFSDDMVITKGTHKFYVNIKEFKNRSTNGGKGKQKNHYVPAEFLDRDIAFAKMYSCHNEPNAHSLLLIKNGKLTKASKELLAKNRILFFDNTQVEDLIAGVDILQQQLDQVENKRKK